MNLFRPRHASFLAIVTNTAARFPRDVVIDGDGVDSVRVANYGNDVVMVAFGDGTVTATVPAPNATGVGVPILPRSVESFLVPESATHVSLVSASAGSHAVYLTSGQGI